MKLFHLHYSIWAIMVMVCVIGGMLFRGQQDIIREQGRVDGIVYILKDLTPAQLGEIQI